MSSTVKLVQFMLNCDPALTVTLYCSKSITKFVTERRARLSSSTIHTDTHRNFLSDVSFLAWAYPTFDLCYSAQPTLQAWL